MISVVIPSFNRYEMLKDTLPSYLASSLVKEVVIIEDGGTDQNWTRMQTLAEMDPRVRVIRNKRNLGAPASRNRGISLAQGELLLLSEDDLELGPGFLEKLLEHMQATGADIIAGRRLWLRVGETREQALKRTAQEKNPVADMRWLDHCSTALPEGDVESPLLDGTMLMRRSVVEQVRYHEPYGGPSTWREETDFQLTALQKGLRLVFCPHVVCFHHARLSVSFGANRLKGDMIYLGRIYHNNVLLLNRHRKFLAETYPQALVFNSPRLMSLLYLARRFVWLLRSEGYRWYMGRKYKAFQWK